MGMTSAAEAKLDARIRPEIAVMRSRTSYPKRRRAATAEATPGAGGTDSGCQEVPGGGVSTDGAGHDHLPATAADQAAVTSPSAGGSAAASWPARTPVQARTPTRSPAPGGTVRTAPGRTAQARTSSARLAPGRTAPARTAPARTAVPDGRLRLTRRGRVVVGTAVAVAALTAAGLLWLILAGQARAASHTQPALATAGRALTRVVVRPGQTLYSIALAADPTADPRVIIREIVDQNALASTSIQVGQVLWVPRG